MLEYNILSKFCYVFPQTMCQNHSLIEMKDHINFSFYHKKIEFSSKVTFSYYSAPYVQLSKHFFQNPRGIETCVFWTKTSSISQKCRFKSHNLLSSYKQNKFDRSCNTQLYLKDKTNFKMQDFMLLEFKIHVKWHLDSQEMSA